MKTMNKIALALVTAGISVAASAAAVKVEFVGVDDYRDIEAINTNQASFQEGILKGLTEYFEELVEELPADHNLDVTVTDLDITGRIEPTYGAGGMNRMRIVDRLDYPRIEFSYSYTDASGAVIDAGQANLKDLGATQSVRNAKKSGRDELYYEKRLLDSWFKNDFKP